MSHADYLRELLRPLRVYELTGTANGGELEAVESHLEAKREIAVELQVKAPTAKQMDVTVQVAARAGADSAAVIRR